MKRIAHRIISSFSLAVFRRRPIETWPAWVGNIQGIKVPSNVAPNKAPSPTGAANINILLDLVERVSGIDGDIAECGIYRGATLIPLAVYLKQKESKKVVFGLDSFVGFDDSVNFDIKLGGAHDTQKRHRGFEDTSYDDVVERIVKFHLDDTVQLIKGYFENTLGMLSNNRFSFVHLDCDIYSSYKQCLEFFYPRMNKGGIVLLDEYNDPPWPGCNKAIDEFFRTRANKLQLIERNNYQKYYFVKD